MEKIYIRIRNHNYFWSIWYWVIGLLSCCYVICTYLQVKWKYRLKSRQLVDLWLSDIWCPICLSCHYLYYNVWVLKSIEDCISRSHIQIGKLYTFFLTGPMPTPIKWQDLTIGDRSNCGFRGSWNLAGFAISSLHLATIATLFFINRNSSFEVSRTNYKITMTSIKNINYSHTALKIPILNIT